MKAKFAKGRNSFRVFLLKRKKTVNSPLNKRAKNVSLRERVARGLAFDEDSLFGFFNQASEFTESNVRVIESPSCDY